MMRAKMTISRIEKSDAAESEALHMYAVTTDPDDVANEDNSYAKYTPAAELTMTIENPALLGTFRVGQVLYLDFSAAN